jgi:anti-sigma regulatory factor (Ser/Thr protein kinase)
MHYASTSFHALPSSAAEARAFVVANLSDWHCPDFDAAIVELLTSELMTNAFLHGSGPIRLDMCFDDEESAILRVEVGDGAAELPVVRESGPQAERGRGMMLVETLATRWGTRSRAGAGKVVWFELDSPGLRSH